MTDKKPSDSGLKLSANLPSKDDPEANLTFETRYENDNIVVICGQGEKKQTFKVSKLDFVRAIVCLLPGAVSSQYLNTLEKNKGSTKPKVGNQPPNIFNMLLGGLQDPYSNPYGGQTDGFFGGAGPHLFPKKPDDDEQ